MKLCTGEAPDGKSFKDTIFHRVIPGFMLQVRSKHATCTRPTQQTHHAYLLLYGFFMVVEYHITSRLPTPRAVHGRMRMRIWAG